MSWWQKRTPVPIVRDPARRLMERCCDGDADAFRELYTLLAPVVLTYLAERGCRRESAEQVLEATFLELLRNRNVYVRGADPRPWLIAVAERHTNAVVAPAVVSSGARPRAVSA